MELADSHVHLADFPNPDAVVGEAKTRGMVLLSVSTDVESAKATQKLREGNSPHVRFFAGVHPSEVRSGDEPEGLDGLLEDADGVGEIGLDPKYSPVANDTPQAKAFARQLEAAERLSKPVQVHSRGAVRQCLDRLSSFTIRGVLMHWLDDEESLREVTSRGYYVSFGPALLSSKKLRRMARAHPMELTLVESDGPVTYRSLGSDVRGSFLIPSVVFALGEVGGIGTGEAAEEVYGNTLRFLSGK